MKALCSSPNGPLYTKETSIPEVPHGSVRIRVHAVGICRTDLDVLYGKKQTIPGRISGHEFSGVIEMSQDSQFTIGQKVVVFPVLRCHQCENCEEEKPLWECLSPDFIGVHRHGAFAEYIVVPSENVFLIPSQMSFSAAAYWEPVAAAWGVKEAIQKLNPPADVRIGIFGQGRIAKLTELILQEQFPYIAMHPQKKNAVDIAIECSHSSISDALYALCLDGHLILKSRSQDYFSLPAAEILCKKINLIGCFYGHAIHAFQWLHKNQVMIQENLFGKTYALSEYEIAFQDEKKEKAKIFFDPRQD